MSNTKHTPGPWAAMDHSGKYLEDNPWTAEHEDSSYYGCAPIHAAGTVVALAVFSYEEDQPEDANARLIAAAPDLLEALQAVQGMMIPGITWADESALMVKRMVTEAIAKATGGAA